MDFKKIVHQLIAKRLAKDHRHFKLELRHKAGNGSCIVDDFIDDSFNCRFFDGELWINEDIIPINDICNYEIIATFKFEPNYFYTPSETRSIIKIIILYITRYPAFFNKLRLFFCENVYFLHLNKHASAAQRNKLLEFLVKKCADSGKKSFNTECIFKEFYKKYDRYDETYKTIYSIYIDSLCENEDIKKDDDKIILLGNSINTIDKFNSQKTYQRTSCFTQVLIMLATFVIAYYAYKNP